MNNLNNDFLIIVDTSYFRYYIAYGAVSEFQKIYPNEASIWIKKPEETDQSHLPNLLNCDHFKTLLKKQVMKRLETIEYIAKCNFQNEIDSSDKIDIIFAMDDRLKNNFRLNLYPAYKGQRKLVKRSYDIFALTDYISNIIFKELNIENRYGYHCIQVEGAEGDDVIATILTKFKERYSNILLLASDHDYLQIEGIHQYDLFGRKVQCKIGNEDVSAEEFLLGKILMGDKSDNISQVFKKCGPKTALKLIKNKELLEAKFNESPDAINQFELNRKIISFKEIPEELSKKIIEKVNVEIYDRRALNENANLKDFMEW